MSKSNQQYWAKREEEAIKHRIADDERMAKELEKMYKMALKDIHKDIAEFYMKYAIKGGMTIQEAQKLASEMDVKEFAQYAKEYVKTKDFSPKANEELGLYNLKMKISRLELLEEQINMHLCSLYDDTTGYLYRQFNKAAYDQTKEQAGILGATSVLTRKDVEAIVNASFKVGTFSDNIWADKNKLKDKLMKSVVQSIVLGKHPDSLGGQFAKDMNVGLNSAKRILCTEVGQIQIAQQKANYIENDIDYYQIIREPGACKHCVNMGEDAKSIDGAPKYKVSELQPGVNAPLFHPYCRCSTIPVVDKYFKN